MSQTRTYAVPFVAPFDMDELIDFAVFAGWAWAGRQTGCDDCFAAAEHPGLHPAQPRARLKH